MSHFCTVCAAFQETGHDPSSGNVYCVWCGHVIEESTIVSEITFAEQSDGSSSMVGQFVPESGVRGMMRGAPGTHAESREITLIKAKRRIGLLADQLLIASTTADQAHRVFKLALTAGFTRGRKAGHVAAACLYVACRRDKTPHMLLDFSEVLQTDVFLLGHTFLQLIRKLSFQLPLVEPFLYVRRFAAQLEFGDKYNQVVSTALKLVGSMKRDWMQTGRRPAGICAAAILISARIHGFRRTQEEVSRVVKMCAATVGKRLKEFEDTPVAQMTPEEFENANEEDFERECDPPAFLRSQLRKRLEQEMKRFDEGKQKEQQQQKQHDDADDEQEEEEEEETETEDGTDVSHSDISAMSRMQTQMDGFDREFDEANRRAEERERKKKLRQERRKFLSAATDMSSVSSSLSTQSDEGNIGDVVEEGSGSSIDVAIRAVASATGETQDTQNEDSNEDQSVQEDDHEEEVQELQETEAASEDTEDEELLSDSELDEELKGYIVTDENERKLREMVWDALNAKYLARMEEKRKQRELEEQQRNQYGRPRKQRQRKTPAERRQQQQQPPAQSAAEAAASMLRNRTRRPIPGMSNISSLFSTQDEEMDDDDHDEHDDEDDHSISNIVVNRSNSLTAKRRRLNEEDDDESEQEQDAQTSSDNFVGDTLRDLQASYHETLTNSWM